MDKITVIGFTSSGKTTYLAGMYSRMTFGVESISLHEPDEDQHDYLTGLWRNILQGEWPVPSDDKRFYKFNLRHCLLPVMDFEWLDYPGAALVDASYGLREEIRSQLAESSCLLLLINGESFAYQGNPERKQRITAANPQAYTRIVHNNLMINRDLDAIHQLTQISTTGTVLPPIAIVVTKCDLIEDQWIPYVSQILTSSFAPVFGKGLTGQQRIVMLSAVTLGNDIEQGGFADPVDIELPIAFAVLSILRNRIMLRQLDQAKNQKEYQQKDTFLRNIFTPGMLERLKKENKKLGDEIEKMSRDAVHLLELFDPEKPIYINGEPMELRKFFLDALNV